MRALKGELTLLKVAGEEKREKKREKGFAIPTYRSGKPFTHPHVERATNNSLGRAADPRMTVRYGRSYLLSNNLSRVALKRAHALV